MLHECIAITSMNTALLRQLVFIVSLASNCLAQADAKATKNQSDSMVLVRGGTIQIGIDASEISRFEKSSTSPRRNYSKMRFQSTRLLSTAFILTSAS